MGLYEIFLPRKFGAIQYVQNVYAYYMCILYVTGPAKIDHVSAKKIADF